MLSLFIKRPVLSSVISILLLVLGLVGLWRLPVELYPDIAPPTVKITATYTGASAETVLKSIIIPLEEAINGVEGMTYITSSASNNGVASINVFFDISINADIAAVNVQNRVNRATSLLPATVVQTGITVAKSQNSALMFVSLYTTSTNYDEIFMQNFARINVVPKLQRVQGVGEVSVFGSKEYAMRIWLNPQKMANYQLMPSDIQNALREQNVEAPIGKFGENTPGAYEYNIRYKGRLYQTEAYENIIIKSLGFGHYLRLKDVAEIKLEGFNYAVKSSSMGKPSVIFGVFQTPGSNASTTIENIEQMLKHEQANFPKGIIAIIPNNTKDFLDASMEGIIETLIEAFLLVFVVVFIFLQNIRATLIPIISVPVSIVGTFFFLNLFGYSLNMLTMFALVLSIGIVVDDAIVVVEAVFVKLESGYKSAQEASIKAMSEISGAVVSITLVLISVFIPVMFITGSSGKFYQQFAVTLAVAVSISALNALTLSPALCALILKPHTEHPHQKTSFLQRFHNAFNVGFQTLTQRYVGGVNYLMKKKWMVPSALVVAAVLALFLFKTTPKGFIPNEDTGRVFLDVTMPPGTSLYETEKVVRKLDSVIAKHPMVKLRIASAGNSLLSSVSGPSYAFLAFVLKDWKERKDRKNSMDSILAQLNRSIAQVKEAQNARLVLFIPPTVRGFGNSSGFDFNLLDKGDDSWKSMDNVAKDFASALMKRPEISFVGTTFNASFPQYELSVNVEKVKDAGLSLTQIFNTLQGYYGGLYTTDFNRFGKQYRVMISGLPLDRTNPETLNSIFVSNKNGQSVSIREFIELRRIYDPEVLTRYNLFKAVTFNGKVSEGYSTGDALRAVQEEAAQSLPNTYTYEFTGLSREETLSGNQSVAIFILSLIFVYLILSALYESFMLPFSVIFSLVLGVAGSIAFIRWADLSNNIYFQVSLIMLLGLLAKNAILIVDVAVKHRRAGDSLFDAAWKAGQVRLRPILMTSFAFILGIVPLAFSNGVGAIGNRSIGMGAFGGLLMGTLLGVFAIPILFIVFRGLHERCSKSKSSVSQLPS